MKLVVIGGHTRGVGKTSLAAGIIAASRELRWTAFKITQYGHGMCSENGEPCGCAVETPDCPYSITQEFDAASGSDTARFLAAGADSVYWARTRVGNLRSAVPELQKILAACDYAIMESNSILEFLEPDLYLPVLSFDAADFKPSSRAYHDRADAYAAVGAPGSRTAWPGVDLSLLRSRPVFPVTPPSYCSPEIVAFVRGKLAEPAPAS